MKSIAVVFAAALALGAAMPAAQAAQNTNTGGTALKVQTDSLLHVADEVSARKGGGGGRHGHGRGGGGGRHGWHGGGGGRHGWHGGGRRWHGHGGWHGRRNWGGHRHWYGGRGYGWRGYRGYGWRGYGYGWPRHRVCWRVWSYGRLVTVCRWRRW